MRKMLLACATLVAGCGGAWAADIPVKAPPPPPALFTWGGFYGGVYGGGVWEKFDHWAGPDSTSFVPNEHLSPANSSSWVFGTRSGYNVQFNQIVLGVETAWSYTDLRGTSTDIG